MSTEEEITKCVRKFKPDVIFHTNSVYPSPVESINLKYILWLRDKYRYAEIGYSGHEFGLTTTYATAALGVTWVERHVTLDRTMWGTDQLCSIEPTGLIKLVKGLRDIEKAMGKYSARVPCEEELEKREMLSK